VALPSVRLAVVDEHGALRFDLVPGTATWTLWQLPDQYALREEVTLLLGDFPGALASVPLGAGLIGWRSDVPAVFEPNPVATRMIELLADPASGRAPEPGRTRGPLVVCAWTPGETIAAALDARQRQAIEDAHAHAVTGQLPGVLREC
jgi:hypothetical protein